MIEKEEESQIKDQILLVEVEEITLFWDKD